MSDTYTNGQIDILLNHYFRDAFRAMPFPVLAEEMGLGDEVPVKGWAAALNRVLWGLFTGYGNPVDPDEPTGPRQCRVYAPTGGRWPRNYKPWYTREDTALRHALGGEGQDREPPVDVAYIARVLQRDPTEVRQRWGALTAHVLGRSGFGLGDG